MGMLVSCGGPKGPLPPALRRGRFTYLHEARLSAFDGLGDGSFAVETHSRIEGAEQTEVNAYFSLGDELVRVSYGGKAPLSSVRLAVIAVLGRDERYR